MYGAAYAKQRSAGSRRTAATLGNFDILRTGPTSVESLPSQTQDLVTKRLDQYRRLPLGIPDEAHTSYLLYQQTTSAHGIRFFANYLIWYSDTVLLLHESKKGQYWHTFKDYLDDDPFGTVVVPETDTICWEHNDGHDSDDPASEKSIKTQFKLNLEKYQKWVYIHCRASLPLFMDAQAKTSLNNWIIQKETGMDKLTRLHKENRIPWLEFETYVLSEIFRKTLDSFHYLPLHQLKREDDQLFIEWAQAVREVTDRVKTHGGGWEKIIDKEALHVLKDWLTDKENTSLQYYLVKVDETPQPATHGWHHDYTWIHRGLP